MNTKAATAHRASKELELLPLRLHGIHPWLWQADQYHLSPPHKLWLECLENNISSKV